LDVWTSYYVDALDKMVDIHTEGSTEKIKQKIKDTQRSLQKQSEGLIEKLKPAKK
jgi:hypothetical protein